MSIAALFAVLRGLGTFSIPAAAAAVAVSSIATQLLDAGALPIFNSWLLFTSTLSIYNIDHALDSRGTAAAQKYRIVASAAVLITLLSIVWALWAAPAMASPQLLGMGVYICGFIVIYFMALSRVKWLQFIKELLVSGFFTLGCFIPVLVHRGAQAEWPQTLKLAGHSLSQFFDNMLSAPLQLMQTTFSWKILLLMGLFYAVLLHNAFIFSVTRSAEDLKHKTNSLILYLGTEQSQRFVTAWGLLALLAVLSLFPLALGEFNSFYKYYLVAALCLQGILFTKLNSVMRLPFPFQVIGDGYFLLMALLFHGYALW